MKLCNLSIKALFSIATIFGCISQTYAKRLTVVWEKELGKDENFSYMAHEAAYNNNNNLQIIGYAFDTQTHSAGKYWLSQISSDGNVVSSEDFYAISNVRPSAIVFGSWQTKGLKTDSSGMYCAGKFGSNKHSFAKFRASDKKFIQKQISRDPNKIPNEATEKSAENILKMINLTGNKFLFVGMDANSNGVATKVDADGSISWYQVYDKGKISFVVDAIEIKNGLVLVECYTEGGTAKNYYEGYNCRLIRCDSEGRILSEKCFEGGGAFPNKYPELHNIDSNSFLLSYDKYSRLGRMEYSVATFDGNLELLKEKTVFNKETETPAYAHITPVSSGGFIVAFNDDLTRITLNLYSNSDELLASLSLPGYIVIDNFQIVGSGNKYFVIASTGPVNTANLVKTRIAALTIE
jgi:hypothetical protein